jgi:acyl-coenzyme A synthetase/AMP-(fatty) acid ligase
MSAPAHAKPAIITADRQVDPRALDELAATIHAELARAIRPGARLGVWVEDPVGFAACVIGASALRTQALLIPPDATSVRAAELCDIEGSSAVLCDEARAAQLVGGTARVCAPGLVLVTLPQQAAEIEDDQGSIHFFTSGTDGRPRGVVRTKQSLEHEELVVGSHLGMETGSAVLCTAPVAHAYGFVLGLFAPLARGATAILARPRFAASLAKLLITHRPEIVVAVPAQFAAWSATERSYAGPMPRLWVSSGAPLSPAVRARFETAWGAVIAEQYGMTECGAVSIDLDASETLGRPYPGVTVSIDGADSASSVGEVVVDTPYGASGYVGTTTVDQAGRFTADGFRTADTGWLDAAGRLHVVGRRSQQLNVRGHKVDPIEVERAFWEVDGVHDVAVVGIDRADGDQWICAFVVCSDGVTDGALHEATAHLESFRRPQKITRLPELPKTPTGKTDHASLRAAPG